MNGPSGTATDRCPPKSSTIDSSRLRKHLQSSAVNPSRRNGRQGCAEFPAVHQTLITVHESLIAVHQSLITVHESLITVHESLTAVHRSGDGNANDNISLNAKAASGFCAESNHVGSVPSVCRFTASDHPTATTRLPITP